MPRGNQTGSRGQGSGRAKDQRQSGGGRGRGGGYGSGPGGNCVCPGCGEKAPHSRGTACTDMKCPKCGALMTRE